MCLYVWYTVRERHYDRERNMFICMKERERHVLWVACMFVYERESGLPTRSVGRKAAKRMNDEGKRTATTTTMTTSTTTTAHSIATSPPRRPWREKTTTSQGGKKRFEKPTQKRRRYYLVRVASSWWQFTTTEANCFPFYQRCDSRINFELPLNIVCADVLFTNKVFNISNPGKVFRNVIV